MDAVYFPPTPRPRTRGWRKRRTNLGLLFCIIGLPGLAGLLFTGTMAYEAWGKHALGTRGILVPCRVTYASYGASPTVELTPLPQFTEAPITVSGLRVISFGNRLKFAFYVRLPGTSSGVCVPGPDYGEFHLLTILAGVGGLGVWVLFMAAGRSELRDMRLHRHGIELVTGDNGRSLRVAETQRTLSPPYSPGDYLRVGTEFVVLASPDLKHVIFTRLEDTTVDRLVGPDLTVPVMPPPVRAPDDAWSEWMRGRSSSLLSNSVIIGGLALLAAVFAGIVADRTSLLIVAAAGGIPAIVVALVGFRRHWSDVTLWREGDEVHAVVLDMTPTLRLSTIHVAFLHRAVEYGGACTVAEPHAPLEVRSPAAAPLRTRRVVVLVDPLRPRRWSIVPASCAVR